MTEFYPAYQPVMEGIARPPGLRGRPTSARMRVFLNVAPPEVLARFQARDPARGPADDLRRDRGRAGDPVTRLDDPLEVRLNTCGACQPGIELRIVDVERRPRARPGRARRDPVPRLQHARRLLEVAGEDRRVDPARRLGDDGRPRRDRRAAAACCSSGASKETLKVGGENVAPQEVESQLCTHPAVEARRRSSACPTSGCSRCRRRSSSCCPGATATEEELIEHCRGRIASFKVPRLIRFIDGDEWPMSATKIQRFGLRDRLLEELGTGS